ncbi:MAG: branched-chain amino acid transport system permease protein, partial [Actinomycetota bacterium]|nr:branched-chain amino acid transport system permease protein [Actinomycetota bacterium]
RRPPRELSPEKPSPAPKGPAFHRRSVLRGLGVLALLAFVLTMPYDMKWAGSAFALDYGVIIGMIVLSVSVLGWIGEFTLAVVAQMGFGLVVVNLLQSAGLPFLVIIPVVILSSIPISILLGVFALRLRGVYFAIATLAFGYMAQKTFFQSYLGVQGGFGGTDSKAISRPAGFQGSESFYFLLMGSLLLMALICWAVNKSWIGTSLTALRESEAAFSVLGHSPGSYKMFTICLSGAIATVAGAYFGMLQGLVPSNYFQPALAVLYFGFAVAGGMGSVGGACVAGIAFGAIPKYFDSLSEGKLVGYDQFFIGVVALAVVLWAPGGFAVIGRRIWRRLEGSPPAAPEVSTFEIDVRDPLAAAAAAGAETLDGAGA